MAKAVKRVAVTGAGGQVAYSLLFRIASGEIWGRDQPVALHLLEVGKGEEALKGVVMELEDCAFPLLKEIRMGSDPQKLFAGVHLALLLGAKPRGPGMERKDLLKENGPIFVAQGRALNGASPDVRVLVVGNPCNTNCLIAMAQAAQIPKSRFFSMTRLDQNRAAFFLAKKAGVSVSEVSCVTIWGNHSTTAVPDFVHARVGGRAAAQAIADQPWLEGEFVRAVQQRGAEVIAVRGKSSAASAAHAVIEASRSLLFPTPEWFSMGCLSDGNPYGVAEGLVFSFPCINRGGQVEIVRGLTLDPFLKEKIAATERELVEEKKIVESLV